MSLEISPLQRTFAISHRFQPMAILGSEKSLQRAPYVFNPRLIAKVR